MKKSQVLRAAVRDCLREEFEVSNHRWAADRFLCNALDLYADQNPKAWPAASEIQRDIRRMLGPSYTIQDWLRRALKLPLSHKFDLADLYAYRKRWAEHMAQQYEAQGD